ncbi:hypothetical protein GDO86_015714 [Hymenochirus boettgeri]|uniref:Uncharacterized protein n=1 Tax=Hymenochirus boettgeri TaxID=247094 RepID=A0A8T2K290_9PIPI|nr:hypothetical protein GDO86_015714 [Hymenochirus boettgeri]
MPGCDYHEGPGMQKNLLSQQLLEFAYLYKRNQHLLKSNCTLIKCMSQCFELSCVKVLCMYLHLEESMINDT